MHIVVHQIVVNYLPWRSLLCQNLTLISSSGALCDEQMVESRFRELLDHSKILLKKKWLFGVLDDFITKQLPHNVTWGLSLLYAMEHKGDRASTSTQGEFK